MRLTRRPGLLGIFISAMAALAPVCARHFQLAVTAPFEQPTALGPAALGAINVALRDFRDAPGFASFWKAGHSINITWADTKCDANEGLRSTVRLWANKNGSHPDIDAFIGPACDPVCQVTGRLVAVLEIPMISYGCESPELSNQLHYPTLVRTVTPDTGDFFVAICERFQWNRVLILTSSAFRTQAQDMEVTLDRKNIRTSVFIIYPDDEFSSIASAEKSFLLKRIANGQRVFYLLMESGYNIQFMKDAAAMGLNNGEFAFVSVSRTLQVMRGNDTLYDGNHRIDAATLEGLLLLSVNLDGENEAFVSDVVEYSKGLPFDAHLTHTSEVSNFAFSAYDAMLLFMLAANETVHEGYPTSSLGVDKLLNRSFLGKQGQLTINELGDAESTLTLQNFQSGKWVKVAIYTSVDGKYRMKLTNNTIIWPGGGSFPVRMASECGQNCFTVNKNLFILFAVVLPCGFLIVGIIYRWRRKKSALTSPCWRVPYDDIVFDVKSTISRVSILNASISNDADSNLFGNVGRVGGALKIGQYDGQTVVVKALRKTYVHVTDAIVWELNLVRSLCHNNVNKFIGACVEPRNVSVLSSYCSKGSLSDLLASDSIKLDRIFKLSFATDIVEGLLYIHQSPIEFHGRFKSSNVLVDSRWTCKVSDMGLWHFREGEYPREEEEGAQHNDLLWTAPEHLRQPEGERKGSQKCDVYAFAIVLHEIITRTGPFGGPEEPAEVTIARVRAGEHPPYRPRISDLEVDEQMMDMMRICWEEIPLLRPSFATIRDSLRSLNSGKKLNLVDQMMMMMEKYTDNLEDLVVARTRKLQEEERRTEQLLCSMLPKLVAERLKRGKHVPPEHFDQVTILFSDVVGFTEMAASSTPMQVVDMLNDLYTCFDNIIDGYDAYKVETIGDAYMVASGLPVQNGIRHAGQVCTLTLHLLSAVRTFKIRHMPERQLQMRAGVHSGPVVAGVVGLKMPRYCLFGDTVNFASRMESSGLALRIHVSPDCKKFLDQIGGYHLESRGLVSMKGKGMISTYLLTGKDGFLLPLPDLSKAAPISAHEFK